MTLSLEKVAAHKMLEAAVEAITVAYKGEDSKPSIVHGYLLIVGEVRMFDPNNDDWDDEQDVLDIMGNYTKRGQSNITTLGLAHEYIRHYNSSMSDRDE